MQIFRQYPKSTGSRIIEFQSLLVQDPSAQASPNMPHFRNSALDHSRWSLIGNQVFSLSKRYIYMYTHVCAYAKNIRMTFINMSVHVNDMVGYDVIWYDMV